MIDVAVPDIYSFASGLQKLMLLEEIPDELSSQNKEVADFREYVASKRAIRPFRKDVGKGMSLRKEMLLLAREELGTSQTRSSVHFQNINLSRRGYYN